jgi:hypothetical protein
MGRAGSKTVNWQRAKALIINQTTYSRLQAVGDAR